MTLATAASAACDAVVPKQFAIPETGEPWTVTFSLWFFFCVYIEPGTFTGKTAIRELAHGCRFACECMRRKSRQPKAEGHGRSGGGKSGKSRQPKAEGHGRSGGGKSGKSRQPKAEGHGRSGGGKSGKSRQPKAEGHGRSGGGKSGKSRQPKAEGRGRSGGGKKVIRCGIKTMPEWMVCFYNSRKET